MGDVLFNLIVFLRYQNSVAVEKRVYKNLKLFMDNKNDGDDLFDRLNVRLTFPLIVCRTQPNLSLIEICFDYTCIVNRCMLFEFCFVIVLNNFDVTCYKFSRIIFRLLYSISICRKSWKA